VSGTTFKRHKQHRTTAVLSSQFQQFIDAETIAPPKSITPIPSDSTSLSSGNALTLYYIQAASENEIRPDLHGRDNVLVTLSINDDIVRHPPPSCTYPI
jgi:hypothetical protein